MVLVLVERRFGATVLGVDTKIIVPGIILVVVIFTIAWNVTNTLCELSWSFFCLVLVLLVL